MAANLLSLDERKLFNSWLCDYVAHSAWTEFSQQGTVEEIVDRDFITGVLNQRFPDEDATSRQDKIALTLLCCRLSDGEDYLSPDGEEVDGKQITFLETAAQNLHGILERNPDIDDTDDIVTWLKMQAVFVCCRNDDFHTAHEVFYRLWRPVANPSVEGRRIRKRIEAVTESKSCDHRDLTDFSYANFLQQVKRVIEKVVQKLFSERLPFLMQTTRHYHRSMKEGQLVNGTTRGTPDIEAGDKKIRREAPSAEKNTSNNSTTDEPGQDSTDTEEGSGAAPAKSTMHKKGSQLEALKAPSRSPRKVDSPRKTTSPTKGVSSRKTRATRALHPESASDDDNVAGARHQAASPSQSHRAAKRQRPDTDSGDAATSQSSEEDAAASNHHRTRAGNHGNRASQYGPNRGRRDRHQAPALPASSAPSGRGLVEFAMSSGDSDFEDYDDLDRSLIERLGAEKPRAPRPRPSLAPRTPLPPSAHRQGGRTKWTDEEEERLYQAVKEFGVGQWAAIKEAHGFVGRSSVQLKDKWRTVLKQGRHNVLLSKYGKIKGVDYL